MKMPRKPVVQQEEAKIAAVSEAAARRSKKKDKGQWKMYAVGAVGGFLGLLALYLAITPEPGKKGGPTKADALVNDQYTISDVTAAAEGNFTAAASPFFDKWTIGGAQYGLDGISVSNMIGISGAVQVCESDEGTESGAIPPAYDPRESHEGCFPEAYDSGNCSSSYAIAAAEVLAARYCIADNVKYANLRLSPQQILSCDKKSRGCNGGVIDSVWSYIQRRGLYPEECVPYAGEKGAACTKSMTSCEESRKFKVLEHCVLTREKSVKREIYNRGPVVVPVFLRNDYLTYSNGVYTATPNAEQLYDNSGKAIQHGVALIGWGKSQGTSYWIVKHSWGASWGENGYARVAMDSIINDNYAVVAVPATEENIAAAEQKKADDEKRKEEARKERAERDARIAENRKKAEEEKAAQQEATDDAELDLDDDFEAEVDLDSDDGASPAPSPDGKHTEL